MTQRSFPTTFGYTGEFWADEFQARASWSRTAIRPDLREVSETSYVDPLTDELTFGNPDVIPSEIDNFDVRFDFIWTSGNSFTVGAFYKDIQDPIEFYETPASDTNRARGIINAESSELTGIEVKGCLGCRCWETGVNVSSCKGMRPPRYRNRCWCARRCSYERGQRSCRRVRLPRQFDARI